MTRRLRLAVVGLATLALLTSCDLLPRGCPQGGVGDSGVIFTDIPAVVPPRPASGTSPRT